MFPVVSEKQEPRELTSETTDRQSAELAARDKLHVHGWKGAHGVSRGVEGTRYLHAGIIVGKEPGRRVATSWRVVAPHVEFLAAAAAIAANWPHANQGPCGGCMQGQRGH